MSFFFIYNNKSPIGSAVIMNYPYIHIKTSLTSVNPRDPIKPTALTAKLLVVALEAVI